jgi:hypothetical protein
LWKDVDADAAKLAVSRVGFALIERLLPGAGGGSVRQRVE